jgi:F0F1-type ATP synthase assembly protein I
VSKHSSSKAPKEDAPGSRQFNDYARLSGIGLEFSASVALVGWLGWLLDEWTGLADRFPLFLLLGVFAGLALGIYRLQLKISPKPPEPDSEDQENDSE